MKFTIINTANADLIMETFKAIQGRATARTIDSFADLESIVDEIEARLVGISKTAKSGTLIHYNFQQHFPNSYRSIPESTHFVIMYKYGAWRINLDSIKRTTCPNNKRPYRYNMELSLKAQAEVLAMYE